MNYEAYIPEALELVSAWEIPLEDFAQVVNDQARIMAGTGTDTGLAYVEYFDAPYAVAAD